MAGGATAANQVIQITEETAIAANTAAIEANQTNGTQTTQITGTVPLPTGAATAANQTTQETTLTAIQANQTNGTQTTQINGTVPLPTGAATSANQTNGNQKTQVTAFPLDTAPATQNVTVQDTGSTTTAQANGQSIITGSATAGSTASFTVTSQDSIEILVSGTWTGTLSNEISFDGGTSWFTRGVKQTGSSYIASAFTQNFQASGNITGVTNVRIRATAAVTGTAVCKVIMSDNHYVSIVTNPLTLRDFSVQSIQNSIKAASTLPLATDTALVVTLRDTATISNASIGANGSAIPTSSTLIGAENPSLNLAPLQTDANSNLLSMLPDLFFTGAAAQTATVNNIIPSSSGSAATDCSGYHSATVQIVSTGTGGTFIFEVSEDNTNFVAQLVTTVGNSNGAVTSAAITATSSAIIYLFPITARYVRVRIVSTITGGSIQAFTRISQNTYGSSVPSVQTTNTTIAQPAVITDVSGAITTTTTTATIAPTQGSSYYINVAVTAVAGTLPTMLIAIQESLDAGTNWITTYTFPLMTATGSFNSPMLQLTGRDVRYVQTITGSAGQSFTRSINRAQASSAIPSLYRNFIDKTIDPSTTNSATASLLVEGMNTYSAIVNQGTGGSAVNFAMDGSDDNVNWINALATCTGVTGGATPVSMSYAGTSFRYVRVRTVTGVASATINNVSISGIQGNSSGKGGTLTNRSGATSGTPSTSTQIMAANPGRKYLLVQNLGATNISINFTASADATNSILLLAGGGSFVQENSYVSTEAVNVFSAGTSIAFMAKEG